MIVVTDGRFRAFLLLMLGFWLDDSWLVANCCWLPANFHGFETNG